MTKGKQKVNWKNASISYVTSKLPRERNEFLIRKTPSRNKDHKCETASITKAKKRKNERLRFLPAFSTKLIIMAAAMWWCSTVDDCIWVEVSAEKLTRCPIGCACYNEYEVSFNVFYLPQCRFTTCTFYTRVRQSFSGVHLSTDV